MFTANHATELCDIPYGRQFCVELGSKKCDLQLVLPDRVTFY